MIVDVSMEVFATVAIAGIGGIAALHGRAVSAENKSLKTELESLKESYTADIKRIYESHDDIWQEIKVQRESLIQNREAVVKLTSSIERLNEILPRLEVAISDKVSESQCSLIRQNYVDRRQIAPHGRREIDRSGKADEEHY